MWLGDWFFNETREARMTSCVKVLNSLHGLTTHELLLVNKASAQVWEEKQQAHKALLTKGTKVSWRAQHTGPGHVPEWNRELLHGTVLRRGPKNVKVTATDGTVWTVTPSHLALGWTDRTGDWEREAVRDLESK